MEFTTKEWTHIFSALSHRGNDIFDKHMARRALVSEDEDCFSELIDGFYEDLNTLIPISEIQLALIEKIDLGDRTALTREELIYNFGKLKESKKLLDTIIENAESETDDSSGVLGDKAQD